MPADLPAPINAPTEGSTPTAMRAEINALIDRHLHLEGPMLPILHAVQAAFGHIPPDAHGLIATALNLTRAEVHGVVSFYHDFREEPAGRHMLKLCRAEACQAVGAHALAQDVLSRLGVDWHGTTADGAVTVEPVYCLGLCACGPALSLDGRAVGRVDAARLQDVLRGIGA